MLEAYRILKEEYEGKTVTPEQMEEINETGDIFVQDCSYSSDRPGTIYYKIYEYDFEYEVRLDEDEEFTVYMDTEIV